MDACTVRRAEPPHNCCVTMFPKCTLFNIADRFDLFVSSITVFELFAGATDERKKKDVESIISAAEVMSFSTDIAKEAGELYILLKNETASPGTLLPCFTIPMVAIGVT